MNLIGKTVKSSEFDDGSKETYDINCGSGTEFLVVEGDNVVFRTSILSAAKEYLKRYFGVNPSRVVAEVNNGIVKTYPHIVGGVNQDSGLKVVFNKFWWNWPDFKRMIARARNYVNSSK